MDVRPGLHDGGKPHESDMFAWVDGIADFEIGSYGSHMHVAECIAFEWALSDAHDEDIAAAPSPVGAGACIDESVARCEDLARVGFSGAIGIAGAFIKFTEFGNVVAGFSDEGDDGGRQCVDDGAHAIIFFADDADIVSAMFTV